LFGKFGKFILFSNFFEFTLIKNENFQKNFVHHSAKIAPPPPQKKSWNLGVGVKGNWSFGNLEYLGILVIYTYIFFYENG